MFCIFSLFVFIISHLALHILTLFASGMFIDINNVESTERINKLSSLYLSLTHYLT